VKHQQRVSTAGKFDQKDIGAVAKKDEKLNRRTGKDRLSTGKEEKRWDKFKYTKKQKNVE
jgi:hypothetical protein